MSRTITAMFNDRSEADQAAAQLRAQIGAEARIIDQSTHGENTSGSGESSGGFWSDLKEMFVADDDRSTYEEGVRRGHFLLCANVPEDQADRACMLIESAGAVDVDENEQKWRSEGWSGAQSTQRSDTSQSRDLGTSQAGFSGEGSQGGAQFTGERSNIVEEERIPIVEEQLRVGKREEQRGGARVRSYVEERPVSEQVSLREEHVDVTRRPVNESISPDALDREGLLQDREIEMRETAERPVIAKEARVTEEVVVQKTAQERTEQVSDTVRNTRVDVDEDSRTERGAMFDGDREDSVSPSSSERTRDPSNSGRY